MLENICVLIRTGQLQYKYGGRVTVLVPYLYCTQYCTGTSIYSVLSTVLFIQLYFYCGTRTVLVLYKYCGSIHILVATVQVQYEYRYEYGTDIPWVWLHGVSSVRPLKFN